MAEATCSAVTSSAKRLLTCFCGCTQYTEDDVKRIYRLSVQETLINVEACNLLKKFFQIKRSGDKSEAEQCLEMYKLCEQYMDEKVLLTEDEVETLSDLGLPYNLEKALHFEVRTGNIFNINRCLYRIQGYCRNEIEGSQEYKKYKEAVLNKLKGVNT